MDFTTALSWSARGKNAIWVIVDSLIEIAHFIPFYRTVYKGFSREVDA